MRLIHILVVALMGATPLFAQQDQRLPLERGSVVSPILTIDSERAFVESAFGQRVAAQIEAEGVKLTQENGRIQAELEAREQKLTELRADMAPDEFRALADAFDADVQKTRAEQAAKGRAFNARLGKEQEVFLTAARPVLEQLMREAGAAVILERRSVFVSVNAIDITSDAISLLNETLGSGTTPTQP